MAHPFSNPIKKYTDENGDPLVGGKLYSYQAGTSTLLATYADQSGTTPNSNPIILDANGECEVWLGDNTYKFVLTDENDTVLWTVDGVTYLTDGSVNTAKLANNSVTTAKLVDGAVTEDKLEEFAVINSIPNLGITEAMLAANSVSTSKIQDSAVTTAKIADNSITTAKIVDANVTNAKLAASAVTIDKTAVLGTVGTTKFISATTSSSTFSQLASLSVTSNGGTFYGYFYGADSPFDTEAYFNVALINNSVTPRQVQVRGIFSLEVPDGLGGFVYHNNTLGFQMITPTATGVHGHMYPPGAVRFEIGYLAPGSHTIKLNWRLEQSGTSIDPYLYLQNMTFVISERLARHI